MGLLWLRKITNIHFLDFGTARAIRIHMKMKQPTAIPTMAPLLRNGELWCDIPVGVVEVPVVGEAVVSDGVVIPESTSSLKGVGAQPNPDRGVEPSHDRV